MIKISTDNFKTQSHPPVIIHFEQEGSEREYIDELYFDGDISKIVNYIKNLVSSPKINKDKFLITGTCRIDPKKNHIFLFKHSAPEVLYDIYKRIT